MTRADRRACPFSCQEQACNQCKVANIGLAVRVLLGLARRARPATGSATTKIRWRDLNQGVRDA